MGPRRKANAGATPMAVVYLGTPVPAKFLATTVNRNFEIPENVTQNSLISSLFHRYRHDLYVITVASNFGNPSVLNRITPRQAVILDCGVRAIGVGNLNFGKPLYYLSIIVTYTLELIRVLRAHRGKSFLVVTGNAHVFTALPVVLARLFFRLCYVPFIMGTVESPEYTGLLGVVARLTPRFIRSADATLTYVAKSALDYTNRPYLEIVYSLDDRIVQLCDQVQTERPPHQPLTIMYAGTLDDRAGAGILLDTIRQSGEAYHWVICGKGKHAEAARDLSDQAHNVDYLGVIRQEEVIQRLCDADLLISLRPRNNRIVSYYASYAASAKLTEYLLSGTPVLVSDVGSIASAYRPYLNLVDGDDPATVLQAIERINQQYDDCLQKARLGQEYVKLHATSEYQGEKIIAFLEKVWEQWARRECSRG